MKIVVTGARGVVGQCVILQAIAQGHEVIAIDINANDDHVTTIDVNVEAATSTNPYTFIQADLRNFETTLKLFAGCEALIHLAGIRWPGDGKVETHNMNVILSWNVLRAAAELGITRIAQASSVNAIGLFYNQSPTLLDYLPLDENHPCRPDDPYSLSKVVCELQADTIARRYPHIRIASLRLHHVVSSRAIPLRNAKSSAWKHLWGYTLESSCAQAFLSALIAPETSFPVSHQVFFMVEPDVASDEDVDILIERHWKGVPIRKDIRSAGFFDCGKSERMLGWKADSRHAKVKDDTPSDPL